ncbi:MAG: hypothetical protein IKI47_03915, partial [Prevotella sp.]|nr:hypothetical protein [Prevotella sp.]
MKRLFLPFLLLTMLLTAPCAAQTAQKAPKARLHKLSPMLRQLVREKEATVCAFIRITGDAERILRENGCRELA